MTLISDALLSIIQQFTKNISDTSSSKSFLLKYAK